MQSIRQLPVQPRRDAWVEINLGAIERNARAIRKAIPKHVMLMAIVKADSYGHGAAMILPVLEASGVGMAGVASVDEAMNLRRAGCKLPILVIGGVPDWAVQFAPEDDIRLSIFDEHHLDILKQHLARVRVQLPRTSFKVHIKIDTGMHRIGVPWERAADFIEQCRNLPGLEVEGIFSHLANTLPGALRDAQLIRWNQVCEAIKPLPKYVHIANSGFSLSPGAYVQPANEQASNETAPFKVRANADNLARLGIAFFGYGDHRAALTPAMGLKARILHIQELPPKTGVSYGFSYETPADCPNTRLATIPIGYADGIPRCLSNKISGFLRGIRVPQVGTITMDQIMFDISAIPDAQTGEAITLLGAASSAPDSDSIWLDDWAKLAGTIEWELMCALRVRLPKTYIR